MSKWLVTLFLVLTLNAQTSVEEFLINVAAQNPMISSAHLKYKQEANKYYINLLPERPEISWENSEILNGNSIGSAKEKTLSLSQKFKFPAVYLFNHRISNLEIKIAYQDYLANGIKILLTAQKELYKFILLKKKETLINEFLNRYSLVLQQTEKLKNAGEISEMDLLRISLEFESLLNVKTIFNKDLISQKEILKSFYPEFQDTMTDSIFINTNLIKIEIKEKYDLNLPQIKRSNLTLKKSDLSVSNEYFKRFPDFTFSYLNQRIENVDFNGFEFGISIPLWIPKEIEEVQNQSIQHDISIFEKKSILLFSNQIFENNWNKYQSELENWNRYNNSLLPKAERVFTIANKQYNAGETTYFEFIDNYRIWKNIRLSELDQRLELVQVLADLNQTDLIKYLKKEIN